MTRLNDHTLEYKKLHEFENQACWTPEGQIKSRNTAPNIFAAGHTLLLLFGNGASSTVELNFEFRLVYSGI